MAQEKMEQIENELVQKLRARGMSEEEILACEPRLADAVRRVFDASLPDHQVPATPPDIAEQLAIYAAKHHADIGYRSDRAIDVTPRSNTTIADELARYEASRTQKASKR